MVDQEEDDDDEDDDDVDEDDIDERHVSKSSLKNAFWLPRVVFLQLYPPVLPHTVESYKHKEPPPILPTDNMVTNHETDITDQHSETDSELDIGKHTR